MVNDAQPISLSSDDAPTISVVIPTYNRADVLPRTLDSVLEQTYNNIELVVVDDASTDATKSIVKGYEDPRIRYISHKKNSGGSAARNTGLKAAKGAFVAFLDDDDEWHPRKIEAQLKTYNEAHESVGVVYSGIKNVDSKGRTNSVKTPKIEGEVTKELLLENFIGSFSALLVDSGTINSTGLLDERFPSWQDWEYYIRLSKEAHFAAVPEPLVVRYNADHEQISDDLETKITETYPLLYKKFDDCAAEYGQWFRRRRRGCLLFHLGYAALSNNQYALAREFLTKSILYNPTNFESYVYWFSALGGRCTYRTSQTIKRWLVRQFS
ncbi:glycosyltransferase family 2 protein [Saliphagus sp. LR7]|uniref:glycosyltransferase family 2 protein n=1 Tax=Saliphagus sp. LR7 TaxID=2282654 RepID=UPI000DF83A6B|nr:glycosyltransferase family 2 protein [Saliphagus sp. LR7]